MTDAFHASSLSLSLCDCTHPASNSERGAFRLRCDSSLHERHSNKNKGFKTSNAQPCDPFFPQILPDLVLQLLWADKQSGVHVT